MLWAQFLADATYPSPSPSTVLTPVVLDGTQWDVILYGFSFLVFLVAVAVVGSWRR